MNCIIISCFVIALTLISVAAEKSAMGGKKASCRFAKEFSCSDFKNPYYVQQYLNNVIHWESKFAQPGVGYDAASGYTYDGHPLDYKTGQLYGEPHLFSASSKESIHMAIVALALDGNPQALQYVGGRESLIYMLTLKMKGYSKFNEDYPGFGCYTPWIGFDQQAGTFLPMADWMNRVPGLDNGEWFWSLFAIADMLEEQSKHDSTLTTLAKQYREIVQCQISAAKTIFYRGNGEVADVVNIVDNKVKPTVENYFITNTTGRLNDPYEGETMTQILYLLSDFESEEERQLLWDKKRALLQSVEYVIPLSKDKNSLVRDPHMERLLSEQGNTITVQRGFWFSTHEQWKALLLPYVNNHDLQDIHRLFKNAEKARVWDAVLNHQPGLLASINDVTDGSQNIPDYSSACGVAELAFQTIDRRDIMTPYGAFGLFLFDQPTAFCWYNNMLQGPRMQSAFGSTEAINKNGTEISPLTTWDSKQTTVLAMLGGIGHLTQRALKKIPDTVYGDKYQRFVHIVKSEYARVFPHGSINGDHIPFVMPQDHIPQDSLSDWDLTC